jgi:hypothetical protein
MIMTATVDMLTSDGPSVIVRTGSRRSGIAWPSSTADPLGQRAVQPSSRQRSRPCRHVPGADRLTSPTATRSACSGASTEPARRSCRCAPGTPTGGSTGRTTPWGLDRHRPEGEAGDVPFNVQRPPMVAVSSSSSQSKARISTPVQPHCAPASRTQHRVQLRHDGVQ